MNRIDLKQLQHNVKIGDKCGPIDPNVTEDSIFYLGDEPIGFYIKDISNHSKKLSDFINIANKELRSKNVPKSEMGRTSGQHNNKKKVQQFSTIIGSVPPRPHNRRPYPSISSVHNEPKAKTFIKAMLLACRESEDLIKKITPNIYNQQLKLIQENVPEKWRFGKLFTSSISNYNISAPFHRDGGNIEGCVNVIIAKKQNAKGGNTTVPDYGATVDSCDNSMLVYPAWKNVHGVTPIEPTFEGGYRNSLVFYPLKAFKNY